VTESSDQADSKVPPAAAIDKSKGAIQSKISTPSKARWLKLLLLPIIIPAIGAGAWLAKAEFEQRIALERSTIAAACFDSASKSIDQKTMEIEQRQSMRDQKVDEALSAIRQNLSVQDKRLHQFSVTNGNDWLFAEALYLARLANQRLQTERSTKNPLALLESADVILKRLDDPELIPVRAAVADDIAALRLADEIDLTGLYLELSALAEKVDELGLLDAPAQRVQKSIQLAEAADQQKENQGPLDNFMDAVSKLVRVSQRYKPIEPLLQGNEAAIVRHNMRLMIELAQNAVIRQEQTIYSHSLDRAQSWLEKYFQLNSSAEIMQQRLSSLRDVQIVQQLPDINGSLMAIDAFVGLRKSQLSETDDKVPRQ